MRKRVNLSLTLAVIIFVSVEGETQIAPMALRNCSGSKEEEHRRASSPPKSPKKSARPLTTDAVSEFDPLSALNLARAADPWLGNSLLSPTACSYLDSAEGSSALAVSATSLKVVAFDEPDAGEDWSEFVSFAPQAQQQTSPDAPFKVKPAVSLDLEGSNQTERERHGGDREQRDSRDGSRSSPSLNVRSPSTGIRTNTPTAQNFSSRQSFSNSRDGDGGGFASALLARLLSLGSSSSPRSNTSDSAPKRNYDSYDVSFEHGPVGLDLETDWYGHQAVVKGFRAINTAGDEGPAKRCGLIRVGDVLTAINGDSCLEMNFQETLEALRRAGKSRHTLHFKSLEAAGDLSVYANDQDLVQARAFIHQHKQRFYRPPPVADTNELVQGCIERLRGEFVTALNFHHEDTGAFLLAASCASDGSGPFIFHTMRDSHLRTMRELPQSEDSAVYLGRLEPSFLGTEFTLFDHHADADQQPDHELAFLVYTANVLGRVPNSLKCVVSKPDEDEQEGDEQGAEQEKEAAPTKTRTLRPQPSGMGSDGAIFNTHSTRSGRSVSLSERYKRLQQSRRASLAERLRRFSLEELDQHLELATDGALSWLDDDDAEGHGRAMRIQRARLTGDVSASMQTPYGAVEQDEYRRDLLTFETKKPSWNETLSAWTLNFQGRVKVASKKNFLLVSADSDENGEEQETTVLRFGKVSKTRFTLDYAAPLAPIQALAIACSAFANKIAVT
ncbi:hypothetical protein BBJ28_00012685 [Nothophytophthora sp. Chile5]|nr:hypothetical protein BBJ28_00012685 [Nothophytophthora sp. Chile5]